MRIVFLDFDGVLNGDEFLDRDQVSEQGEGWMRWWADWIDPVTIGYLNAITDRSGAKLVLSSNRRYWADLDDIVEILRTAGMTGGMVGKTPYLKDGTRGTEIQRWLDENPGVESFAILDDVDDMGHLVEHLVKVDPTTGLANRDVEKIVEMLRRPPSVEVPAPRHPG